MQDDHRRILIAGRQNEKVYREYHLLRDYRIGIMENELKIYRHL